MVGAKRYTSADRGEHGTEEEDARDVPEPLVEQEERRDEHEEVLAVEQRRCDEARAAVAVFTPDPADDAAGLARAAFLRDLEGERALLPDPYIEDPERIFAWAADPVLKEVEVRACTARHNNRVAAVQQYFGLNRDELKKWRWSVYEKLDVLRKLYESSALPPNLEAT